MKGPKTKAVVVQMQKEFGLTQQQIYDIVCSPLDMQAMSMKKHFDPAKGELPMLRIPNFGIFVIPELRQKYLNNKHGFISDEE